MFFMVGSTGREDPPAITLKQSLAMQVRFVRAPGSFYVMYVYGFVGLTIGIYAGYLYKLVVMVTPDADQVNYRTGLVFICMGVCQATVGFILRYVSDLISGYNLSAMLTSHHRVDRR